MVDSKKVSEREQVLAKYYSKNVDQISLSLLGFMGHEHTPERIKYMYSDDKVIICLVDGNTNPAIWGVSEKVKSWVDIITMEDLVNTYKEITGVDFPKDRFDDIDDTKN